jgi:hypothetical protein
MNEAASAGANEISPRPEQVEPPKLEGCGCAVGLFNQLRQRVARGEVLREWFAKQLADRQVTASYRVDFEAGEFCETKPFWEEKLDGVVRELVAGLKFSGGISLHVRRGQAAGTALWETYRAGK